jgi:RimJ/RimL family protein N-acetyltransferase
MSPEYTDDVVRLRVLRECDAPAHLAGEDVELWRWLTEKPGTLEIVAAFIARNRESFRVGGPIRNFGIWDEATGALAGNCEANLALAELGPDEANISYAVWPQFRGRGYAGRAVELLCTDLVTATGAHTAVIRVEPANVRSVAVASRAGFVEVPSPEPKYRRFARPLRTACR